MAACWEDARVLGEIYLPVCQAFNEVDWKILNLLFSANLAIACVGTYLSADGWTWKKLEGEPQSRELR
jgi:hypothetical protein